MTKDTKWFVSTYMRPNMARSVFPCYDEPAFKVPFIFSVARHKNMTAVTNMPLESTRPQCVLFVLNNNTVKIFYKFSYSS